MGPFTWRLPATRPHKRKLAARYFCLLAPFDREALARYLAGKGHAFDPAQPIRQFAGGLANRNYLVVVDGNGAVLRRPSEGKLPPGAHDMAREHRIISRICHVLPFVPQGLHHCADTSVIGVPFQLIEYRGGIVVRGTDMSAVAHVLNAPVILCAMLIDVMAAIHAVDTQAVGLGQMPTVGLGFWTRRMAAERYAALTGRDISDLPAMRVLAILKLSIVFLQLHRQWDGAVTDPRYRRFRETGEELLLYTRNIAKGLGT